MAHRSLPDPPLSTPMFPALLLRGEVRKFVIAATHAWSRWLSDLAFFVRPILVQSTLNFPNTLAQTSSDLNVTVAGAQVDHHVEVIPPNASVLANALYYGWVSAANTVTVRFCNFSTGALNPDAGEFTLIIR